MFDAVEIASSKYENDYNYVRVKIKTLSKLHCTYSDPGPGPDPDL